jgi:hypothetical protein
MDRATTTRYSFTDGSYDLKPNGSSDLQGWVYAEGGTDTIWGSHVDDSGPPYYTEMLDGMAGDDLVVNNGGPADLYGGYGIDYLWSGEYGGGGTSSGYVSLYGEEDGDHLFCSNNDNCEAHGGDGADQLCGSAGFPVDLFGGLDNDTMWSHASGSTITGNNPTTSPGDVCGGYGTTFTGCESYLSSAPAWCW